MEIRIKLPIEVRCSHCGENVSIANEIKEDKLQEAKPIQKEKTYEQKKTEEAFFNLVKKATLNEDRFEPYFKDFYRIIGEDYLKDSMLPKPIRAIRTYFKNLEYKINATFDPRELLKLSNKLVRSKAIVSKKVENEIYKQKKRVLGVIKKRVKELKKKKGK